MMQILEGIRIVDLTHGQVGPYASAMLADIGAEVIHVEERELGDITRQSKQWFGIPIGLPHGRGSIFFEEHNRNKKSLAVDLRKEEGRALLYQLVEKSDVFLSNMRPQVLRKYRLDYEDLKKYNPKIIYALGTSFGLKGAEAEKPSLDLVSHARSGAMMASGEPDMNPVMLPVGLGDRLTAMLVAYGIMAAIYARDKYGVGQMVDVSMLASMATLQGNALTTYFLLGQTFPRFDRSRALNPLYNYYKCQDGRWIALSSYRFEEDWPIVCRLVEQPDLLIDPRFKDEESRNQNAAELVAILDAAFARKNYEEWKALFKTVDILFAPVQTIPDLANDPQMLANDYIIDWDHPVLGKVKAVGFPIKFSETPATLKTCAPDLGQHTEEILINMLGYTKDQVNSLKQTQVI